MNCHGCAQQTLRLFCRSLFHSEPVRAPRHNPARFFSAVRQHAKPPPPASPRSAESRRSPWSPRAKSPSTTDALEEENAPREPCRTNWRAQKAALKAKLNGEAWNPRKKLSPDTMEGIRHLNSMHPDKFTTPVLSQHFKVSVEAIRRILKGNWRPNEAEYEERMRRWDKRGERIWSNLVEMGVKPPKKWREMGVGRAVNGERPKWKGRRRVEADVGESVGRERLTALAPAEPLIPIVHGKESRASVPSLPLSKRI